MYTHCIANAYAGLFAEMGLGKTPVCLSVIDYLMYLDYVVRKCLIIAPKNVADSVWTDERDKWDDFNHIRMVKIMGTEKQRLAALREQSDVYIINVDNVPWLVDLYLTRWDFDMVIIDESSCFKNSDSQRFRKLSMVKPFLDRVVILTGTPMPNGLGDLWPQLWLLDEGKRLGLRESDYRKEYLYPGKTVRKTGKVSRWDATDSNAKRVYKKIDDICVSLKEKDWITLPPIIYQDHKVKLNDKHRKQYEAFEEDAVLKFFEEHDEKSITAVNLGVLTNKLIQYAGGSIYDEEGNTVVIHDTKLDVVAEIIESAQGKPVLIAYQYKHQLQRMLKRFGGRLFQKGDVAKWNRGEYDIMYLHPKSGGHGLNLQAGGSILIWLSPTWSTEQWLQLNKRLHRSGQKQTVVVHRILAMGTMDIDCVRSVNKKEKEQDGMMNAINIRRLKYKIAA